MKLERSLPIIVAAALALSRIAPEVEAAALRRAPAAGRRLPIPQRALAADEGAQHDALVCHRLVAACQRSLALRPCGPRARRALAELAARPNLTARCGHSTQAQATALQRKARSLCARQQLPARVRNESKSGKGWRCSDCHQVDGKADEWSCMECSGKRNESESGNESGSSGNESGSSGNKSESEVKEVKVQVAKIVDGDVKVETQTVNVADPESLPEAQATEEDQEATAQYKLQEIAMEEEELIDNLENKSEVRSVGVDNEALKDDAKKVAKGDAAKSSDGLKSAQNMMAAKNLTDCAPASEGGKDLPPVTVKDMQIVQAKATGQDINDLVLQENKPDKAGKGRLFVDGDMRVSKKKHALLMLKKELFRKGGMALVQEWHKNQSLLGIQPSRAAGDTWPNGQLPYCFDPNLDYQAKRGFLQAIGHFQSSPVHKCLNFYEVGVYGDGICDTQDGSGIYVQDHDYGACWADLGWYGPEGNFVNLGMGCEAKGLVVHEIGHTLGMDHEQSRPDRDNNVKIFWDNIKGFAREQFDINPDAYTDREYDFLSVMHYGTHAFSTDKIAKPTLMPYSARGIVGGFAAVGQMMGLSVGDQQQLGDMYCPGQITVDSYPSSWLR